MGGEGLFVFFDVHHADVFRAPFWMLLGKIVVHEGDELLAEGCVCGSAFGGEMVIAVFLERACVDFWRCFLLAVLPLSICGEKRRIFFCVDEPQMLHADGDAAEADGFSLPDLVPEAGIFFFERKDGEQRAELDAAQALEADASGKDRASFDGLNLVLAHVVGFRLVIFGFPALLWLMPVELVAADFCVFVAPECEALWIFLFEVELE